MLKSQGSQACVQVFSSDPCKQLIKTIASCMSYVGSTSPAFTEESQNIPVVVSGGSTGLPNAACDFEHGALLNSVLWTDITANAL